MTRLLCALFALAVLLGGCRADAPGTDQGPAEEAAAPSAGWDAGGEALVAEGAVLAQDFAAEVEGHDKAEARALALDLAIVARGVLIERIGP
jgi:hypothetical protein